VQLSPNTTARIPSENCSTASAITRGLGLAIKSATVVLGVSCPRITILRGSMSFDHGHVSDASFHAIAEPI
jgi:hypothetical protein